MSNDQPPRRPPAKSSGGGAPMGSTISILIAVIAVVVGFLILRNINSGGSSGSPSGPANTATTTIPANLTTTTQGAPVTAAPTTAVITTDGATVVVANASGVGGAAGSYSTLLKTAGFTTGKATNATGADQKLTVSKVYFVAGAASSAVANSVAQLMGPGVLTATMPTPPPVTGNDLKGATVLVMLGSDLAGKALGGASTTTSGPTLPTAQVNTSTSAG